MSVGVFYSIIFFLCVKRLSNVSDGINGINLFFLKSRLVRNIIFKDEKF